MYGRLVIPANKITEDIEITVSGLPLAVTINYTITSYTWSLYRKSDDTTTRLTGTGTITANVGDYLIPTWFGSGGSATVNGNTIGFGLDGDYADVKIIGGGVVTINNNVLTGPIEGVLAEVWT